MLLLPLAHPNTHPQTHTQRGSEKPPPFPPPLHRHSARAGLCHTHASLGCSSQGVGLDSKGLPGCAVGRAYGLEITDLDLNPGSATS